MFDIAIKSTRIITPQAEIKGIVIIKDGIIMDIVGSLDNEDQRLMDVGDKIVSPGVIDPHVHINDPGRTEWEGFDTATKAALTGGVTTLVDMPLNSSPVTTSVSAFGAKLTAARGDLHVNCGFWGGIIPGNENEIRPLIESGVLGFKAFLTHSGIEEFPNVTERDLRQVMPIIAKSGLPLLVHCELPGEIHNPDTRIENNSYYHYLISRPRKWEDDAIALMIRLCQQYHCHVHIVHLSSSDSIDQIAKAKDSNLPLTVETSQHYLYFNAEQIKNGQTQFKCAPPIREKENNEKIWKALQSGIIDLVATDHSPSTPGLKELESGNFKKAWGGIASLQFALPVLWTAAKERNCSLHNVTTWLCDNPAILIGQKKSKGKIAKGYDADLIIWDEKKSFRITEDIIQHKHKTTPYLSEDLFGVVEQTYLAGEKVFETGNFLHLNKGKIILSH